VSLRSRLRLLRDLATTVPGMLAVFAFGAVGAVALWAILANEAILTLAMKPETYLAVLTGATTAILVANRPRTPGDDSLP